MLSNEQIELLPERVVQRLNRINTEYLESIGKVIKDIGQLRPSDTHRLQQMYQFGSDGKKMAEKLAKVSEKNIEEIYEIFDIVSKECYEYSRPFYEFRKKPFIPYNENKALQDYVKSLAKVTVDNYVNLCQHTAFAVFAKDGKSIAPLFEANKNKVATSLSRTYTAVIDYGISKVQLGVTDYNSAMRECLKALADSGIRTVDYATGYSRRLDTAVRQNILFGIKECNQNIADMVGEEISMDGYEISYHSHPRPSHAEMGGKQYAKGKARTINGVHYPSFSEIEHLLKEPNCLHFKFSILLGISEPAYEESELAKYKAEDKKKITFEEKDFSLYEASQLQRRIETEVRHQKDRAIIAKASGNVTMQTKAQLRINQLTEKYAKLSEASGLPTKMERMNVKGFKTIKLSDVNEARADELLYIVPPIKGDAIKPQSIYKELQKSKIGQEVWEYIENNRPNIEINYTDEAPSRTRGYQKGNYICIYAHNTKTIKLTAKTLIHEITHMKLNIGGDQWAEAVCFMQEEKHINEVLTFRDKRDIIKSVKKLYPDLKWRDNNGKK